MNFLAIVSAASVLFSTQPNLKAESTTKFDGSWSVTIEGKEYKNGDGSTARPYVKRFTATVRNGIFHGEIGTRGKPKWLELNGKIEPDGTSALRADEITGTQEYNFAQSRKAPPGQGTSYSYQVVARFDARRGTGHSSSDTRTRILTFAKE